MTIVITARDPGTLTVAGALRGEAIGVLEAAALGLPAGARLDLTDLRGIDETGEALLRRLQEAGLQLTGLSPFLALTLVAPLGSPEPQAIHPNRRTST